MQIPSALAIFSVASMILLSKRHMGLREPLYREIAKFTNRGEAVEHKHAR